LAWYDTYIDESVTELKQSDEGEKAYKLAFWRNMTLFKTLYKTIGKWELPEAMQDMQIYDDTFENLTFDFEYLAYFHEADGTPGILPVVGVGDMNVYGTFDRYEVTGVAKGYNRIFDTEDVVILSNVADIQNSLGKSYFGSPRAYLGSIARQLANAEVTENMNVDQQRNPFTLTGTADEAPELFDLAKKIKGFAAYIFKRKKNDVTEGNTIELAHTQVPFLAHDLQLYRTERQSEALTFLGFSSLPMDKAERMVVSEVKSRDQIAEAMRESRLTARMRFVEQVKAKFGDKIAFIPNAERTDGNDDGREENERIDRERSGNADEVRQDLPQGVESDS